ncbi:ABC-2 family transporter protein [Blastopirellula sp. JC732]|uniref:ABC-2 family transporter protein n=1 Tax=Blastopirellula sediminis TaxID=2894196 RepID=A0A9X1SIS1_9BACT|nr:ABC-2 family transporter protein [Blastopirellula sediminis]MCC9605594.1 ABC-2 family transporter protein [Blastopirellula sediminis]MCC9631106.1 ABC-2 family transporter protein [Blastopirellula sediminis]
MSSERAAYGSVFYTFVRNSLIRDLSYRSNFFIECASSMSWVLMNLGFYLLIFSFTTEIGNNTGWRKFEFFVFLSTTLFINSLMQTFFMPNAQEFSELIRTGRLDFALLKPIDTQFLISFQKVNWPSMSNFLFGIILLSVSLWNLTQRPENPLVITPYMIIAYPMFILCGVGILYSLMIVLAATSIWLGRNQSLYDFWFYITSFSRYPMEIYEGGIGGTLRFIFTFMIPILVVVNVPARIMAKPVGISSVENIELAIFAVIATAGCILGSRWVFKRALLSYRSASS